MLRLDHISLYYSPQKTVLLDLSLKVKAGEVVGIVGASGGGKSSLLKIIAGLLDPIAGSVFLRKEKVKGPSERLVPGHPEIQLVNQDFGLDLYHTVQENVLVKMLYLPKEVQMSFCSELLDVVELNALLDRKAITLSGGEQQRLSIARALASEPEVLLLDEPFSHLDAHLKLKIGNYIRNLVKLRKMACILVSHDGLEIMQWCSRVAFIQAGKIERVDTPEQFYYHPRSFDEGVFFGELNRLKRNGKEVIFRPNEYRLVDIEGISLKLKHRVFYGALIKYLYHTSKREPIVLYAQESLGDEINIEIERKTD
jgi:iron(III) transport system ATP-binding protein